MELGERVGVGQADLRRERPGADVAALLQLEQVAAVAQHRARPPGAPGCPSSRALLPSVVPRDSVPGAAGVVRRASQQVARDRLRPAALVDAAAVLVDVQLDRQVDRLRIGGLAGSTLAPPRSGRRGRRCGSRRRPRRRSCPADPGGARPGSAPRRATRGRRARGTASPRTPRWRWPPCRPGPAPRTRRAAGPAGRSARAGRSGRARRVARPGGRGSGTMPGRQRQLQDRRPVRVVVDGEGGTVRRGPGQRPRRPGDRDPQAVARADPCRRRGEAHGDRHLLAGHQRGRMVVPVAMGQVQRPAGDERRRPVRRDVAQPDSHLRHRLVGAERAGARAAGRR